VSDELAIAFLEDMERQRDARTEDRMEWKQRELYGDSIDCWPVAWEQPKSMGIEKRRRFEPAAWFRKPGGI
jgi:hypothetical protein